MITENNKQSWCVNAFHGMSANNDGSTKMCCMIRHNYMHMDKSKPWNLTDTNLDDNFNSKPAIEIRNALNNGVRHEACTLCWQEEDGGRKSKRLRDNHKYFHNIEWNNGKPFNGLAKFELNLGNTCNIKCRTCHPSISSTWMKEDYELNHKNNTTFKVYSQSMKRYHQTYDEDSMFWEDLKNNLHTIKQFDFYGGEPFLSKKMWEILKICVEKNYSKEIELHYNTNGTNWPNEVNLWESFKEVNLSFSIDGINDRFTYMRFPADWNEVKSNMVKARNHNLLNKNMSLSWCITLSSLNIFYLPEIIKEYYDNFNDFGMYLNLVHYPDIHNISKLPIYIKTKVIEQLNTIPKEYLNAWYQLPGIIGFIENGESSEKLWKELGLTVNKHDLYREQSFSKTFAEYYEQIGKHYDNFLG